MKKIVTLLLVAALVFAMASVAFGYLTSGEVSRVDKLLESITKFLQGENWDNFIQAVADFISQFFGNFQRA